MKWQLLITTVALSALLAGCERPPVQSTQVGWRGTGMVQVENPRTLAKRTAAEPAVPDVGPPTPPAPGPKAKDVYQNVKVLGDLSPAEFTRHMLAITQWVAPNEGCTYCHGENFADDGKYTKVVARRMIEMTRNVNTAWEPHVGKTGVTCYTCHRGKPVPGNIWFTAVPPKNNRVGPGFGDDAGQNRAVPSIASASLPYDPFTPFLLEAEPIRAQTGTALPTGNRASIKQAEWTYSLMNHMSQGLGVNCTFCHNTQSFQSWQGPAQRVTAWHGIRMVREMNKDYMAPLTASFPAHRLGPGGDVAKANCATCHQGVNKPLGGLAMAKDFEGLVRVAAALPPLPAPLSEPRRSVLYFDVGSPALQGEQAKGLDRLVATMAEQGRAVATISGYHSASGTQAANEELAKQRAFTVRDALLAAGIAQDRVKLDKPRQVRGNVGGEDPEGRRVEVVVR